MSGRPKKTRTTPYTLTVYLALCEHGEAGSDYVLRKKARKLSKKNAEDQRRNGFDTAAGELWCGVCHDGAPVKLYELVAGVEAPAPSISEAETVQFKVVASETRGADGAV